MICVENLTFQHPHATAPVVEDVTFRLEQGRLAVLLGPNGSGKTTLFKCIAGLWKASAGKVRLDGTELLALNYRQRATLLAVVPQDHTPPFPFSVTEAVLMGRAPHIGLYAAPSSVDMEAVKEALEAVGISHLADCPYTRISGGERQMTLIARAIVQDAPIMLLDEPTSHLDFRNQHKVLEMVRRIGTDRGLTVLMTLHDPNLAAVFADQMIVLKNGHIVADGQPDIVLNEQTLGLLYDVSVGFVENEGRRFAYIKANTLLC
ncbi:MAG: ABC transporter ATP-binding protein [Desulfuromonadaceae bacterium]|nr:ABC transporter ATP-binding protein [Desulfuromonadaceae bacterium]MDD5107429.1 ABC transporter ATP-binding protein [Desulfuromonadaceae bacterium]